MGVWYQLTWASKSKLTDIKYDGMGYTVPLYFAGGAEFSASNPRTVGLKYSTTDNSACLVFLVADVEKHVYITYQDEYYLAYFSNALDISHITPLENVVVKGKYKVVAFVNNLKGLRVPIVFSCNGKKYTSLSVDRDSKSKCYMHSTSFYLQNNEYVSYSSTGDDLIQVGDVLDFGAGVNIPTNFHSWLNCNCDQVFENTYTVQSKGQTLSTLTEAPPMVKAKLTVVGNFKTLTLTGDNDKTYTMEWEQETPAGTHFLGLAYEKNAKRASIPVGEEITVNWQTSTTLYPVYGVYKPPATTFDITLYQNAAEVNRVDKTDYLTAVATLSGTLRSECSVIAPDITFRMDTVPEFNYVYIPPFNRYYFVTGLTSVAKNLWRMSLSCDVLMSYKDDIRALTAVIGRQENDYNAYLADPELPAQANQIIEIKEFSESEFDVTTATGRNFVLTVVGEGG